MDQEQYLEGTPLGRIILRGIKKLVTEMTSTKFLLLVFICIGIWQKFIQDFADEAIFHRLLKNVQMQGARDPEE